MIGLVIFILFVLALLAFRKPTPSPEEQAASVKARVRETTLYLAQQQGKPWKDPYNELFFVGDELVNVTSDVAKLGDTVPEEWV